MRTTLTLDADVARTLKEATNPRAMINPMPVGDAVAAAKSWLDLPNVDIIEPGPRHAEILFRLLRASGR